MVVERHDAAGVDVVQFDCAPMVRFLRRTHKEAEAPHAAART